MSGVEDVDGGGEPSSTTRGASRVGLRFKNDGGAAATLPGSEEDDTAATETVTPTAVVEIDSLLAVLVDSEVSMARLVEQVFGEERGVAAVLFSCVGLSDPQLWRLCRGLGSPRLRLSICNGS